MRFSLVDFAIFTACQVPGFSVALRLRAALIDWGLDRRLAGGIGLVAVVPLLGIVLYAVLASPIYRRWQLPPLFLPTCPSCGRRPAGYWITDVVGSRVRVVCGRCERPLDLWWRRPGPGNLALDRPSLLLAWPQSIGRWRRIDGPSGPSAPALLTGPPAGP